jgi:4-hydroxybenzoate polyprenyltransferase
MSGASTERADLIVAERRAVIAEHVSPALALRLVGASFWYRLRKREANNLFVTLSLMIAFHLAWWDVLWRGLFAVLLNCFAYLLNDYCDIEEDLASSLEPRPQVPLLDRNRGTARAALYGLGVALVAVAVGHALLPGPATQRAMLPFALASSAAIVWSYSRWLKRIPMADLLAMGVAGATGTMIGMPRLTGLCLGLMAVLALFSASYEMIQVIRDEPADRARQVRTSAVVLGVRPTAWIFRVTMAGTAAFGTFVLGSPLLLVCAAAAAVPLTPQRAARSWDLVRVTLGLVWLGLIVQIFLGHLHG